MGRYAIIFFLCLISLTGICQSGQFWATTPIKITAGGITQVQKASHGSSAASTTNSVTLSSTPVNGNLMLLIVDADATVNTPSGYTLVNSSVNTGALYVFYKVAGASESTTQTVTLTSSTSSALLYMEYNGVSVLDAHASTPTAAGSNTSAVCGPSGTTTAANELVVASIGLWEGSGQTFGPFTSWTNSFVQQADVASTVTSAREDLGVATRIVSATGTYSTTGSWTTSSNRTIDAIIATFK